MAKKSKRRTHGKPVYHYSEKTTPMDLEYYGIHRDGDRLKIDAKRMKRICQRDELTALYEAALRIAEIPRSTTYFLPKKRHKTEYIINEFRMKIDSLREQWYELRAAFQGVRTPKQVEDAHRVGALAYTSSADDYDEICIDARIAGVRREAPYQRLAVSVCAQFIHQMATELDAVLLRKCRYLGYTPSKETQIKRDHMHTYLHGYVQGRCRIEDLAGYESVYRRFFTVWNLLKHNSENLFERVKEKYPEMLLTDTYRNGELSMYYLRIGNDYIVEMLDGLKAFYEDLCVAFFGEDKDETKWNYDDYFTDAVRDHIGLTYQ